MEAEGPDLIRAAMMETEPVRLPAGSRLARTGASTKAQPGPWFVAGAEYLDRSAANRALTAHLGTYNPSQWQEAQRQHGLR